MILEVVQSKWSLTWYDPLGPRMCVLELMNGHVLQTLREQLKVPGSRLEGSELLTSEFLRFRSRLNETSGGLGKIGAVSGSDCRILKFLRTTFLAAKLLGWKVSVKGIRSSLSEADGSKADSLLTFWTRLNYANLFVGYVEEQIFNQFDGPKPELFGRYIDDCLGATSCTKEELERFIGFVNSFHPALKFTWEISETSVTFLDINISVQDNKLATSVHYKPTDSHSYLLYSSSHPSHVKDSIPYSQFLRLRRLCSEDSDFNSKCDEMSNFFSERGYPDSTLSKALNRVQNVNRESALEPSASDNEERIPFTLTFHPNNLAARNVVLRNFKILQSDPETAPIFPNPPLVSFKRDRNLRNSLVRSSLPSNLEPGTFNCSRKVCNTCPFINSKTHIRGPNGSYQVNDHFDCTTSNIIYCITCTLCNKLYIGESGRKLGDRFREHLLDVKNKRSDLSKPVARHFNLPGHSHEHMEICGIYLHLGNNETRKRKEQRLIFKLGTLAPNGINERFSFA